MPQYNPPIRGQEYVFYLGLPSQSDPAVFQANPTLASGDAKVSKDGGSLENLATLPSVEPASSKMVKVTVSASEMDADNVTLVLSDAAGDEWSDVILNIQPSSYAFPGAVDDESATTTGFNTALTQATGFFDDMFILFTDGGLQGQAKRITAYNQTNGAITCEAFTAAPADGDPFIILGRSS